MKKTPFRIAVACVFIFVVAVAVTFFTLGHKCVPDRIEQPKASAQNTTGARDPGDQESPFVKVVKAIHKNQEAHGQGYTGEQKYRTWAKTFFCDIKITDFLIAAFTLLLVAIGGWQGYEVHRTVKATQASADAAQKSALIAGSTLSHAQRAFVFGDGFNSGTNVNDDDKVMQYLFWVQWRNVGTTPALNVQSWLSVQTMLKGSQGPTIEKGDGGPSYVLGPQAISKTNMWPLPIETMIALWKDEIELFVWARVEYRDIFDPDLVHHHEQCASVVLIHEPSSPPPNGHPPYVQFNIHGPRNSAA